VNFMSNEQTPELANRQRRKLAQLVRAVNELGEGVNQDRLRRHLGISSSCVSQWVRQAIRQGFLKNASGNGGGRGDNYSLKLTERGRALIGESESASISPKETDSVEEIILRLSRTVERLLVENDRLKQENERLAGQEQRLAAEGDELLKENLRLEDEVKTLKEQVESYKEEANQLRQIRSPRTKPDLLPRVAHAMAVFGD
jgi:DNA-binding MarR family transcriptional regulator